MPHKCCFCGEPGEKTASFYVREFLLIPKNKDVRNCDDCFDFFKGKWNGHIYNAKIRLLDQQIRIIIGAKRAIQFIKSFGHGPLFANDYEDNPFPIFFMGDDENGNNPYRILIVTLTGFHIFKKILFNSRCRTKRTGA